MGIRILGIELRRSAAAPAALVIAAVGVFVLFASNPPYRSWMELVIVQRDIMQLTWPLALAAGAWQGIRERRSRIEELIATTPRPRPRRVLPVATAMAVAAVVAYLVMLAGGTGHLRHPDAYFPAGAVPLIALGALGLVAAAWLGLAIGALLPSPLTAPMLVVIAFVGLAVVPPMLRDQNQGAPGTVLLLPFLQGPRDGGYELQMLSARANLSQALWLAAVAATGLALLAAARTAARVAALLPALLGAAIAVPAMPRQLAAAWVADPHATEVVCTRDEPRVCVARMHSYALDELAGPARQALSVLAAKLPPAPSHVLLQTPGKDPGTARPPQDTLLALVPADEDMQARTADDLVQIMLDGAGVPSCPDLPGASPGKGTSGGTPPDAEARYVAARQAAGAWLLGRDLRPARAGEERIEALTRQALDALRALPAGEQQARVAALRDAERTCASGDRLDLLTGTSGTR